MTQYATRILLAKIGLDGHDRGVKVLARSFREAGFEVIYTGLWQTAQTTMFAAMQEDVDVVGVSLLSAAHMTITPEIIKHRNAIGIESTPVILGGIIPAEDHATVRQMGVAAIFNPGSSVEEIITCIRDLSAKRKPLSLDELRAGYEKHEPLALARLITHLQHTGSLDGWSPPAGDATVIGVTGSPGVGKSSFIGKLGAELRARGLKVAVVAFDPTSPITGGALLGDRLRMMSAEPDTEWFMRSIAAGRVQGGLGPGCKEVISLLDGYGFDVIFLETVGAGQADVDIRNVVQHVFVLLMPQSGDTVQFSKAGIMEIATHFVLNKCDLDGADTTHAQLLSVVGDDRPIWRVSSLSAEGITTIADWLTTLRRP